MIRLLTGGARAGKSTLAQREAEGEPGTLAFVATGQALDGEMAARIARHRDDRGPRWVTIEAPLDPAGAMAAADGVHGALLLDCLTLWVSNLLCDGLDDDAVDTRVDGLIDTLRALRTPAWVVTNEVGLGIVPADPLSRRYRDRLGRCNQRVAAVADRVTLVVSGLPVRLK